MTENKPHVWEVTPDNLVHTRWCPEVSAAVSNQTIKAPQPYRTGPKTALDLIAHIAAGDSQNQFGSRQSGPSKLKPCSACIEVLAEQEREDLP